MTVVRKNVHQDNRLMTDIATRYKFAPVASHEMVDHHKFEWVHDGVHTNTLEGFFSVLKRGLVGVYQRVDAKPLTAIWRSSISARTPARSWASMMRSAPRSRRAASRASG